MKTLRQTTEQQSMTFVSYKKVSLSSKIKYLFRLSALIWDDSMSI